MLSRRLFPQQHLQIFLCGLQSTMADEEDLQEEENHDRDTVPETMIEIQSPSPSSDPYYGDWSMINNLDHPKIVFPPVNHEGLDHISSGSPSPHGDVKEVDLERGAPPSSPLPTPRPMMPSVGDVMGGWWEERLQLLRFKVAGIVSTFRKFAETRGFPLTFQSRLGPLAGSLMLLLLILRFRRRRQIQRENISDLIRFVREKDGEKLRKLNELVHQVARMNELLQALASQHRS